MELRVKSILDPKLTGLYQISRLENRTPSFKSQNRETKLTFNKNRWQFERFIPGKSWEVVAHSENIDTRMFPSLLVPTVAKVWWVKNDGRFYEDERYLLTVVPEEETNAISDVEEIKDVLDCMIVLYINASRAVRSTLRGGKRLERMDVAQLSDFGSKGISKRARAKG